MGHASRVSHGFTQTEVETHGRRPQRPDMYRKKLHPRCREHKMSKQNLVPLGWIRTKLTQMECGVKIWWSTLVSIRSESLRSVGAKNGVQRCSIQSGAPFFWTHDNCPRFHFNEAARNVSQGYRTMLTGIRRLRLASMATVESCHNRAQSSEIHLLAWSHLQAPYRRAKYHYRLSPNVNFKSAMLIMQG